MTIETDRGKVFRAKWAYAPTEMGHLMVCICGDTRALDALCADFSGVRRFIRRDKKEGDALYEGYVSLLSARKDGTDTIVTLCRED